MDDSPVVMLYGWLSLRPLSHVAMCTRLSKSFSILTETFKITSSSSMLTNIILIRSTLSLKFLGPSYWQSLKSLGGLRKHDRCK